MKTTGQEEERRAIPVDQQMYGLKYNYRGCIFI